VIWVHSSSKAARDAQARAARIEAGLAAVEAVAVRLASPKTPIKTRVAAEQAASTALQAAGATRWVGFTITAAIHADKVSYDAVTDGCFPIITNDTVMTGAEVLAAYHYQPNLERRNHLLNGPQEVAPVYLETAHPIEALLLCHFLAMLTEALIEREIRTSMSNQGLAGIPLYPNFATAPPPAPRASWRSSTTSNATSSSTTTARPRRPSSPNSPTYNGRSWPSSTSQPASTARPTRS
jgi:hypothetical protein